MLALVRWTPTANMDPDLPVHPVFSLYNREWPTMTMIDLLALAAKFVYGDDFGSPPSARLCPGCHPHIGEIVRSIVSHAPSGIRGAFMVRLGRHARHAHRSPLEGRQDILDREKR